MAVTHVIVGLGNPGGDYAETRHNVGFMVVDRLAARNRASWVPDKSLQAEKTRFELKGTKEAFDVLLLKPMTFMNRSGTSVKEALRFTDLDTAALRSRLIVIHDELDLPLGDLKLQTDRGPGGHNGIRSLIDALGTQAFARIRVGIGKPQRGETIDWVLTRFKADERKTVEDLLDVAAEAAERVVLEGVEKAASKIGQMLGRGQGSKEKK